MGKDGDDLYFSVGIASASFPIDNFYECPQLCIYLFVVLDFFFLGLVYVSIFFFFEKKIVPKDLLSQNMVPE